MIQRLLSPSISTTVLQLPVKDDVQSKLSTCQIAHFACHGKSVIDNPSESHLLLCDWETNPLTVSDIVALKLGNPQFAYISACHTAISRVKRLFDESIHLAAACELAGFPRVVGTLWQVDIDDNSSVLVAQDVYNAMLAKPDQFDFGEAALGLHCGVRRVRSRKVGADGSCRQLHCDPLVWASYIHMGA